MNKDDYNQTALSRSPHRKWSVFDRTGGFFRRNVPAYLVLPEPGASIRGMAEAGGLTISGEESAGVVSCHGASDWLSVLFAREDGSEDVWRECVGALSKSAFASRLRGLVVVVDAVRLVTMSPSMLRDDAMALRSRLAILHESLRPLPATILVDNIDRLYGLRTVVARLDEDTVRAPLGALRLDDGEAPSKFITRMLAVCRERLFPNTDAAPVNRSARAALFQAPEELERLAGPLAVMAERVFPTGKKGARLRGAYLVASDVGAEVRTEPSLGALATFRPVTEVEPTAQSWFLRDLVRGSLPGGPVRGRGPGRALSLVRPRSFAQAGMAALILVSLSLSIALTWSYKEARNALLTAAGRGSAPVRADELSGYRDLALEVRAEARDWALPLFGSREVSALADVLENRFAVSYHDLVTVPAVDRIQDNALQAAASGDPEAIGNAFLTIALTREGLDRRLRRDNAPTEETRLLRTLAALTGVVTSDEIDLLETYFDWAGLQEWMPATRDTLREFERYLLASAPEGNHSWFIHWLEGAPALPDVHLADVFADASSGEREWIIPAIWTRDAYYLMERFLELFSDDDDVLVRRASLDNYRLAAVREWETAARNILEEASRRENSALFLREAALGRDPASRFLDLAAEHLLPMDPGGIPEFSWLRLYAEARDSVTRHDPVLESENRLYGFVREWRGSLARLGEAAASRTGAIDLVRDFLAATGQSLRPPASDEGRSLLLSGLYANRLTHALDSAAGASCWEAVSPAASDRYIRNLLLGQATRDLEQIWYDTVFTPLAFTPAPERLDRASDLIETFLSGPARGFWQRDGDRIRNARMEDAFRFDDSFLEVCSAVLGESSTPRPEAAQLLLAVNSVNVNQDALELPESVEFIIRDGDIGHVLEYRNFPTGGIFAYEFPAVTGGELRIRFRNFTARLEFDGEDGVADFVQLFSEQTRNRISVDLFDRETRSLLAEAGIREFIIMGGFTVPDGFVDLLGRSFPPVRSTIRAVVGGVRSEDREAAPLWLTPADVSSATGGVETAFRGVGY